MKTLREALTEALVESERDRLKFWNQVLLDRYGNHVLMPPDHLPDATKKEAKCQGAEMRAKDFAIAEVRAERKRLVRALRWTCLRDPASLCLAFAELADKLEEGE